MSLSLFNEFLLISTLEFVFKLNNLGNPDNPNNSSNPNNPNSLTNPKVALVGVGAPAQSSQIQIKDVQIVETDPRVFLG